jgi:hypothetical protein
MNPQLDKDEITNLLDLANICAKSASTDIQKGKMFENTFSQGLLYNDAIEVLTSNYRTENQPLKCINNYIVSAIIQDDENPENYVIIAKHISLQSFIVSFVNKTTPFLIMPQTILYKGYEVNNEMLNFYNRLQERIFATFDDVAIDQLILTGWGLGASMATLYLIDLLNKQMDLVIKNILIALFGSPRVMTKQSVSQFRNVLNQKQNICIQNLLLTGDTYGTVPLLEESAKFYVRRARKWGINWVYPWRHEIQYRHLDGILISPSFDKVKIDDLSNITCVSPSVSNLNRKKRASLSVQLISSIGMYYSMLNQLNIVSQK